jgi:hypothetical protein
MGRSIVITKVTPTPQPIAPSVDIAVSRCGVSTVKGTLKVDKALTTMIKFLASKLVPLDQLEIARPDPHNLFQSAVKLWAWKLTIQMTVVSDDGGLDVAACFSLQEALRCLFLPKFNLDEEAKLVPTGEVMAINVVAISGMRFGLFEGNLIWDLNYDEEKVADGCCTMLMTKGDNPKLLKVATSGKFDLTEDVMIAMMGACSTCHT